MMDKVRGSVVLSGRGRWSGLTLASVLILTQVLLVAGCRTANDTDDNMTSAAPSQDSQFQPAAAGDPLSPMQEQADDLINELKLQGQERAAASRAAAETARRLMNDLRYLDAEGKLQEALRLDPSNEVARKLLDQVHFVLGDRSGEIRDFSNDELEREQVRRQQAKVELERLYADSRRAFEDGDYDRSVRLVDKVLEQIQWFHFNQDLSSLEAEAKGLKSSAESKAAEKASDERRQREIAAQENAQAEQLRSLKFLRNRVENMVERASRAFDQREFVSVIDLCQQILDIDRTNPEAKAMMRRAKELRHLYRVTSISRRTDEQWEQAFLKQHESEIPYQAIFNFPSKDHWNALTRKSLSVEDRLLGTESNESREIKARLATQTVTIEFADVAFEEVIDSLQTISNVNFVLTKEAREALEDSDEPVRLAEVKELPLENVLRLVLNSRDPKFSYVIKNGAVVVGPSDSISEDIYLEFYEVSDITTRRPDFKAPKLALDENEGTDSGGGGGVLDFGDEEETSETSVDIDKLVELLENTLWGEDGADEESIEAQGGKLVARTTLESHAKIQKLLDQLRKQTGIMVTVESRFVDLQDNFLESIGVDFGNPFTSNLPNPISDIDGFGTQISPGYEFVDAQGQFDARASVYNAFSLPLGSSVAPFQLSDRGGIAFQYNVLDVYILEAILEASAKTQKFRKLDAPRVTAFNTQVAHSLVVDQQAYVKDAEVNQTGVIPVINPVIGILNSGSILEIRPTVSYDRKYVILEIQPTLATQLPSRFKFLSLGLTNLEVEFPVLNVTKIKTTVTIPDGGTVLVGGLKRTITQDNQVGIPIVSRIPFFNLLFGRQGEAQLQANLFVLINAKITVIRDEEKKRFN